MTTNNNSNATPTRKKGRLITFQLSWRYYYGLPFINMIEKMEDMMCVTEITRVAPLRLQVRVKNKRGMKRLFHAISHENRILCMQAFIEPKSRKERMK